MEPAVTSVAGAGRKPKFEEQDDDHDDDGDDDDDENGYPYCRVAPTRSRLGEYQ
jgi:hypothetical protein